jgi:hypothetical protein
MEIRPVSGGQMPVLALQPSTDCAKIGFAALA